MTDASVTSEWGAFRRLWVGQTVSQVGTAVTLVALPLVAVLQLHASALEVGAITACGYLAFAILGLPAGVYVDRWTRRKVMLVTDAGRALTLAAVPTLWSLGALRIWHLYVVALLVGVMTLFFDVSIQAYLPAIVSREKLIAGNAQLQASTSAAQLAGPTLAGVLTQLIGAATTLVMDAVSYVVSFVCVLAIRGRPETHVRAERTEPLRRQMLEGFRYIRGDPILFNFLGLVGQYNILISAEEALGVIFLVRTVHVRPAIVGLLLAGSGVGAITGAAFAQRLARRLGIGRAMVVGAVAGPILGILLPFTYRGPALACFVIATAGLALTQMIIRVVGLSYRQAIVPAHLLGRVAATTRTVTWGPIPLGALLGGFLGQTLGVRTALLVLAIGMLTSPLWVVRSPVSKIHDLAPEGGGT